MVPTTAVIQLTGTAAVNVVLFGDHAHGEVDDHALPEELPAGRPR